jgi:cell division septation protein DedD
MRIVCPKCDLKGQVDAAPTGAKKRIACVRCATTFDAVFVDGEIQALVSRVGSSEAVLESATSGGYAGDDVYAGDDMALVGDELVSTPETAHEDEFDAFQQVEALPGDLEDFSTSSADLMSEEVVEAAQPAPQEILQELPPQMAEAPVQETADAGEHSVVAVRSLLKSKGADKASHRPSDAYGMGVRLMRVSPVWLLLVGLTFISFIVFCNWLIKPAEQSGDVASTIAAGNNHATNQPAKRVDAPASTAQSPANRQVELSSGEPAVAFIATEAREATPPATPKVEAVEAKPAVEEKSANAATPTNVADGAKAGKVTIQIGSYNAAAEAEERVANLKSAGLEARSVRVEIPRRGTWYRVQSGRFVSRAEAERYGQQLRDKGVVSSFITTDVQE